MEGFEVLLSKYGGWREGWTETPRELGFFLNGPGGTGRRRGRVTVVQIAEWRLPWFRFLADWDLALCPSSSKCGVRNRRADAYVPGALGAELPAPVQLRLQSVNRRARGFSFGSPWLMQRVFEDLWVWCLAGYGAQVGEADSHTSLLLRCITNCGARQPLRDADATPTRGVTGHQRSLDTIVTLELPAESCPLARTIDCV
jgi:hypothetical protein